jgi:hypothetical protein
MTGMEGKPERSGQGRLDPLEVLTDGVSEEERSVFRKEAEELYEAVGQVLEVLK